jgi:hypothetical protein
MLAQVTSNYPGIKIVSAAYTIADIEINVLALIKVRGTLCAGSYGREKSYSYGSYARPAMSIHYF